MKPRINLQLISTLGGGLLFSYLFWMEKQALNLLVYTTFIFIIILLDPEKQKSKKFYLTGAAHFLAAVLVVVNHADLNVITWYISLAVMVGFLHFQTLKSIFASLFAAFMQMIMAPLSLIKKILGTQFSQISFNPVLKIFKYIVIPFIVIIIFSVLYSIANAVFADYAEQFINSTVTVINNVFNFFFADLSMLGLMHLILGIGVTTGIFITVKDLKLEKIEVGCNEHLVRKRREKKKSSLIYELTEVFAGSLLHRIMALKTENIIGVISFIALNLLLLSLNIIDITTLWFGKVAALNDNNYSAELHDGTNALILSIVMAMLVIIYFFSGNLNFYRKNKTIRLLAYLWIIQNTFLLCSVLLRDFNYINAHGLTYKRIGVLVFLLLCSIGLMTVYIKVAKQKTLFYLCKVNAFAWYALLLASGFVNWDIFIVAYNINNRDKITLDLNHLTNLSDKALPLLNDNKELLKKYLNTSSYAYRLDYDSTTYRDIKQLNTEKEQIKNFEEDLDRRIKNFKENQNQLSLLSWNYRDWQTQQYLTKNRL
jgi:hypothetical protein